MLDILGFLTRLPVGSSAEIESISRKSHLFPVVGAFVGFAVATFAIAISRFSSENIGAILTLLFLYALTGLMHLDGLADFADGIFASGSTAEKIRAMKDEKVGISGIFAVLTVILLCIFAIKTQISTSNPYEIAQFFIVSEISAKLSMNACMLFGKSAELRAGIGAFFVKNFSRLKFCEALALALILSALASLPFAFSSPWGASHPFFCHFFRSLLVLLGVAVGFFVSRTAKRHFGAVSGDVLGAANEIARCVSFVSFALMHCIFVSQ